ncbi:hypothetical protein KPATCC21470_5758 [Kitasatospora purpeofusca]
MLTLDGPGRSSIEASGGPRFGLRGLRRPLPRTGASRPAGFGRAVRVWTLSRMRAASV